MLDNSTRNKYFCRDMSLIKCLEEQRLGTYVSRKIFDSSAWNKKLLRAMGLVKSLARH